MIHNSGAAPPTIAWGVLALLIVANTVVLLACLMIEPKTEWQARLAEATVPVTHDLFKIIVGAVVGALGTTVAMRRAK